MLIRLKKLWKDIKGYYGVFKLTGYLRKYDLVWDQELNKLLDAGILIEAEQFVYTFRQPDTGILVKVWVTNFPYVYGYAYRDIVEYRPSLKTMKRLREYQEKVGVVAYE